MLFTFIYAAKYLFLYFAFRSFKELIKSPLTALVYNYVSSH